MQVDRFGWYHRSDLGASDSSSNQPSTWRFTRLIKNKQKKQAVAAGLI